MSENISARIPVDVMERINYIAKEKKSDKSKIMRELLSEAVDGKLIELALEKYSKRLVSIGRGAELARIPLADFMKIAAERRIPVNYSIKDLEDDFNAAMKAK